MSTPILIVLLVVGSLLGSILWVLPSPAERRRMKLREVAYSRGFRVKKQTARDLHSALDNSEGPATYYYFKLGKYPTFTGRQVVMQKQGNWQSVGEGTPNAADVAAGLELPENCLAVLLGGGEVGFLWEEVGTPDDVTKILDKLLCASEAIKS